MKIHHPQTAVWLGFLLLFFVVFFCFGLVGWLVLGFFNAVHEKASTDTMLHPISRSNFALFKNKSLIT